MNLGHHNLSFNLISVVISWWEELVPWHFVRTPALKEGIGLNFVFVFGFIRDTGWQWLNKRILINKNEVSTKTTINVRLKYFIVPCCRRWHKHARAHSVNECPPTSAMTCFGDVAKTSRLRSSRPKISIRVRDKAGQSNSQFSIVWGASPQTWHVGSVVESIRCWYALKRWLSVADRNIGCFFVLKCRF